MNSSSNIDKKFSNDQAKTDIRLQQAITAANLKAITELVSSNMLNETFSSRVGGTFDVEYAAEIKQTPKGLSSFFSDPIITFTPNDLEVHSHLKILGDDSNDIDLSHILKLRNNREGKIHSTKLEEHVEQILNFVEDEIQPEISKYLHQAKRKNDFTKSVKRNCGKNAVKALEVMKLATSVLKEKFTL
jgi:hypothetical protein